MWEEEGVEPERGVRGEGMEYFVVVEEEGDKVEEGLIGLVASESGADWELPLAELG